MTAIGETLETLPGSGSPACPSEGGFPEMNARREWATFWRLPVIGMVGLSGSTTLAYASGVLMLPMTKELGWTRAEFSAGFAIQMLASVVILPGVGWLTDRHGPRRVAIFGGIPFILAFSLLGTTGPAVMNWYLLCLMLAVFQSCLAPPVWISGVVSSFNASRGFAMAVTLSGMSLGTLIWPLLATLFLLHMEWRLVFPAIAFSWATIALPIIITSYKPPAIRDGPKSTGGLRHGYAIALRSRLFLGLTLAGGLFACTFYGTVVHLVPILTSKGMSLPSAAGVASLAGVFSIVGRFGTGHLLDRASPRLIAMTVFLLPAFSVMSLAFGGGSIEAAAIAVAILGLSSGAEMDILTFFASRAIPRDVFASVYGLLNAAIAISAGVGPLIAGAVFDHYGGYNLFLLAIIPVAIFCSSLLGLLPLPTNPSNLVPGDPLNGLAGRDG